MQDTVAEDEREPTIRVAALHALAYCERLFYLEEVEEIRVADAAVYAGRTLHETLARDDEGTVERLTLESARLGLRGEMDALRRRDGRLVPYEHKRGRAARDAKKQAEAWATDRLQVGAYALLLEESAKEAIPEGRVRYHADGVTVRVLIDAALRADVLAAVVRARALRLQTQRPPVTSRENLCVRCSLAPVCLPEEERLAKDSTFEPLQLSPRDDERKTLHVVAVGTRLGRAGDEIKITPLEGPAETMPIAEVGHVVLHGAVQMTTQALHLCAERDVTVSWITGGGRYIGTLAAGGGGVQRRIRQFRGLTDDGMRLSLARRLVHAKVESGLRFVLRATRGSNAREPELMEAIEAMRRSLRGVHAAESVSVLLGVEGDAARQYFSAWKFLIGANVDNRLRYVGRTRRPPRDRVSALLGFGYALLLRDVTAGILAVGLEPAFGIYHQPRGAAPPLALDLMELFRSPLVDMPIVASINRGQWHADDDFAVSTAKVWLSEQGRRKLIAVYEQRKAEEWKHSVVGYSLSYGRMIELEARLLEKEWSGAPGLFAQFRLR